MSKTAEAILLWERAKVAVLVGLGYLAARNPRVAFRIGAGLAYMLTKSALRDTYQASTIIYRELAKPVIQKDAAIAGATARASWAGLVAQGAAGMAAGSQILFLGMGGVIVQNLTYANDYLQDRLDTQRDPITGGEAVF